MLDTNVQRKAIAHPTDSRLLSRAREQLVEVATDCGIVLRQSYARAGKAANSMPKGLVDRFAIARRLYAQRRHSTNKLYALHAPEVERIVKGKARTPFEVGVKVSVAEAAREGIVVGMRSMPGNLYDGQTVDSALEQMQILTETTPAIVLADRGYKGEGRRPAAPG